jgi:RNAse (barnase) inhibitor barstar
MHTQTITLDKNGRLNKQTIMSSLNEAFSFPDYFGDNWDAAYDLLLDYVDALSGPATWRFSINKTSEVNEADLATWAQLMTDLQSYAASQGMELQVVIQR